MVGADQVILSKLDTLLASWFWLRLLVFATKFIYSMIPYRLLPNLLFACLAATQISHYTCTLDVASSTLLFDGSYIYKDTTALLGLH